MLKKVIVFVLCWMISQSVFATQSPIDMLKETSDQMISALKENSAKIKQKPAYVYTLAQEYLLPHVDVDAMSKLALGRESWMNASPQQREGFKKEFTNLMIRTYGSALAAYTDEKIQFKPLREDIGNKQRIQVDSVILQKGGPAIPVSYRVFLVNDQWKVYDMTVDGVSMIQSFRSQFSSEISRGGMDGLLVAMTKHRTATE